MSEKLLRYIFFLIYMGVSKELFGICKNKKKYRLRDTGYYIPVIPIL